MIWKVRFWTNKILPLKIIRNKSMKSKHFLFEFIPNAIYLRRTDSRLRHFECCML